MEIDGSREAAKPTMTHFTACLTRCAVVVIGLLAAVPAQAQSESSDDAAKTTDGMRVQLNKLASVSDACRVYLVFENRTGRAFDAYTLDLVMFGADGAILRRFAVEARTMPEGKTRVKPFDLTGTSCDAVGKILLNEVMTCKERDGAGEPARCTPAAHPESRLPETPFIK